MYGDVLENFGGVIFIWIIVLFIVLLILREVVCWYYKINRMVTQLDELTENAKKQTSLLEEIASNTHQSLNNRLPE